MNQIKYNITPTQRKIEYIVIHDTGNQSKGANALMHYNYFNGADRGASADFFVDDTQALQVNDYTKNYTWHCGDGGGKYGITNKNSIGIEICINSDGDYNKAVANAVALVKRLMTELTIDINHVVRHYDASRKNCPGTMSADNWAKWTEFKSKLEEPIDWKEILRKAGLDDPEKWIVDIESMIAAAKANGDTGPYEKLQYFPALIEKIAKV